MPQDYWRRQAERRFFSCEVGRMAAQGGRVQKKLVARFTAIVAAAPALCFAGAHAGDHHHRDAFAAPCAMCILNERRPVSGTFEMSPLDGVQGGGGSLLSSFLHRLRPLAGAAPTVCNRDGVADRLHRKQVPS